MTEQELKAKEKELNEKEVLLNKKEARLKKDEIKAANGYQEKFVEKFKEVSAPIEAREKAVSQKEIEIAEQMLAAQGKISSMQAEMLKNTEIECAALREKNIKEMVAEFEKVRNANKSREATLEAQITQLTKERDQAILNEGTTKEELKAKDTHITTISKEIASLNTQLSGLENKQKPLEAENAALKIANDDLKQLIDAKEKVIKSFEVLQSHLGEKSLDYYINRISTLEEKEENLKKLNESLAEKEDNIKFENELIKNKIANLGDKEKNINQEIKEACSARINFKELELQSLIDEADNLRKEKQRLEHTINTYGDLKEIGEKAELLKQINELKDILAHKNEELAKYPSEYMNMEISSLEDSKRKFALEKQEFDKKISYYNSLESKNGELTQKLHEIETAKMTAERERNHIKDAYDRLTATNVTEANREERINVINTPFFTDEDYLGRKTAPPKSEQEWLDYIYNKIKNFGLYFPRRILNAFHTALKTAEMSPLTVLAGVSGTGKSELPRLYSYFGGINFLSVPVQPNWDCQESMLGYYNSIDNYFDAQDILKVLAQSQRDPNDNEGLNDVMTLILLDEMNLANIELYFSDFLSKLEMRRGCDDNHVPTLGVKIGAKMPDWQLKLGRNVLWAGTMNQDETTKTLSDKVLDRGIIINFPRPKTFKRRTNKNNLLNSPADLLLRTTWKGWLNIAKEIKNEEISNYISDVEKINELLGKTGRALGHRVWQSIESYMSNYPDVVYANNPNERKKALDCAFADQIVQKVMPKLRGIEVRGEQGKILDEIKALIPESLHDDFENARLQGFGQFMWCSSDYLLRDDNVADEPNQGQQSKDAIENNIDEPAELRSQVNRLEELSFEDEKKIQDLVDKHHDTFKMDKEKLKNKIRRLFGNWDSAKIEKVTEYFWEYRL